jgi:hypothetical protein
MQYSPKLKIAAEEILAILKKHDIAAVVVLHTPGFSEYIFKIDPTYSCANVTNNRLQIKMKLEHYQNDRKLRDQFVSDTVNMVTHLMDITGMMAAQLVNASKAIEEQVEITRYGSGHTSHDQQNN